MRKKKLYSTQRAKKGDGRRAEIMHIQVPKEVKEMLDEFKDVYSACYGRKVSYEQMFRDWLDHGRIDTKVWKFVNESRKARKDFPEEVADITRKAAEEVAARAENNGTSSKEEAVKEKEAAAVVLASVLLDERKYQETIVPDDYDNEPVADVNTSLEEETVQQPDVPEENPDIDAEMVNELNPVFQFLEDWNSGAIRKRWAKEEKDRAEKRERRRQALRANKKYFYVKDDVRLDARLSKSDGISSSFTADLDGRPRGFDYFARRGFQLVNEDGETIDRQTAIDIKKEYDDFMKDA